MSEHEGLSIREKKILRVLYKSVRSMSTKEVSSKTHYAWETCRDALISLAREDYVTYYKGRDKKSQKVHLYWRFNYSKYRELKEKLKRK